MLRPSKRRTPGGLILPRVSLGIRGELTWQVLDERGVPEVPRTPSGVAIGPAEGVRQGNLITDVGLNRIGLVNPFGSSFRRRLHVGTGSTPPDVADVELDNEVQALSGGATNPSSTATLDTDENVFRLSSLLARQVTMDADRNLTEFGLGEIDSLYDDNVWIRELFRDEFGTPVTVSLLNGKTLIVNHTLVGEIAAPSAGTPITFDLEQYDATNTLVSTTPYDAVFGPVTALVDVGAVFAAWTPSNTSRRLTPILNAYTYDRATVPATTSPSSGTSPSLSAYVDNSFEREAVFLTPAASLATTWYGFVCITNSAAGRGWAVVFDDPATYVKPNTDTLEVRFTSTWGRAGS